MVIIIIFLVVFLTFLSFGPIYGDLLAADDIAALASCYLYSTTLQNFNWHKVYELRHGSHTLKTLFSQNFSSSSFAIRLYLPQILTILVSFWFIITSLVFFDHSKLLFYGFL